MRRLASAVALIVLLVLSSGCYHYHLRTSGNKANSSYFRKTLDPSSEGRRSNYVVPPPQSGAPGPSGLPSAGDCKENGLYEVGITSPWKYAAGRVFSFGLWSRVKVEWLCAKEPPVIGPAGLGPQPPAASSASAASQPKPTKDGFTRRTVHAFLWGALQQNLLPPGSKTMKTPANCQSLRQVKLPMNYGYALVTVLSAGIWSPMQVAWKCEDQPAGGSNAKAAALPAKEGNYVD
ncbi:MAG TPA: hypothetical protein VKA60_23900 [Blastocatellia bacterium]|nr:hypothetical protein [Blastocatellia bacterium]